MSVCVSCVVFCLNVWIWAKSWWWSLNKYWVENVYILIYDFLGSLVWKCNFYEVGFCEVVTSNYNCTWSGSSIEGSCTKSERLYKNSTKVFTRTICTKFKITSTILRSVYIGWNIINSCLSNCILLATKLNKWKAAIYSSTLIVSSCVKKWLDSKPPDYHISWQSNFSQI